LCPRELCYPRELWKTPWISQHCLYCFVVGWQNVTISFQIACHQRLVCCEKTTQHCFKDLKIQIQGQQISLLEALCCVCTILGIKRIVTDNQTWFEGFNPQSTKKIWYLKLEGQKTWCQELQRGVSNLIMNLNAYMHNTSTPKKV
jgi:hypothetical protein